jgi:acetylornithine/succinyldiaminopimelate/putrescine aminotransferase
LARKYAYKYHQGEDRTEIISMKNSFHGRTYAAITATGQEKYQKGLNPLMPGIKYADFNNFESLKALVNDKTCAIILEPIQGESGIHPADKEYLQKVRALCDEKDLLLIFDEVQCGVGRTGHLCAYQYYGVEPDALTFAKGLAGGVPIGALLTKQKAAEAFAPGDHASTFGGNPLATMAGKTVITELLENGVLQNVAKQGQYLTAKLNELKQKNDKIVEVRGVGLMQGIEIKTQAADVIKAAMEKGLLLASAGANVIRFVPSLVVSSEEIDQMIDILSSSL